MSRLIVLLLLMYSNAFADQRSEDVNCAKFGRAAFVIYDARQNGRPLLDMLELSQNATLARRLVLAAYAEPVYTSIELKNKMMTRFIERQMIWCYQEYERFGGLK